MSPKQEAMQTTGGRKRAEAFTDEERAAMRERAREMKADKAQADGESEVLAKVAEMSPADRAIAEQVHDIVKASAPELTARTWYGMPAYAKNGKVLCFFQSGAKFKTRYATFGFSDQANLDEGNMWPTAFAIRELTFADATRLGALIKQAAS